MGDIVLFAKNKIKQILLDVLDMLGRWLKDRCLVLNANKSKIVVFNKKKSKEKIEKWKWKDKSIQEVKELK